MKMTNQKRLMSLDALRGFDMMFIMGGERLVYAVAAALGHPNFHRVFGHVPWHGLQFVDTIFPLFLFLAGASFPFSCAKSRERGLTDLAIALKSLRRGLILMVLGLLGRFLTLNFSEMRIWSVLGRIGFAWMIASWLYLGFRTRTRLVIAGIILAAATVFPYLVLAPDALTIAYPESLRHLECFGRGPFSPAGSFGCWLDRTLTGGHTYRAMFDPEGFSGILPSIVTAMLGMFAGEIIRRNGTPTGRTALTLLGCGFGCAGAGLVLSPVCPLNKALWTPSFVLVVGGYSFAMLAIFHWIIDVKGFSRWAFAFCVIGMNSITIYLAQPMLGFHQANAYFFGGLAHVTPGDWSAVVSATGYLIVCWTFLYVLYRKRIFLKI